MSRHEASTHSGKSLPTNGLEGTEREGDVREEELGKDCTLRGESMQTRGREAQAGIELAQLWRERNEDGHAVWKQSIKRQHLGW